MKAFGKETHVERWSARPACVRLAATALAALLMTGSTCLAQEQAPSDLWYFGLEGPVKTILVRGRHLIRAHFDKRGRITYMQCDGQPVKVYRDEAGRIDSTTTAKGRLDDHHNTRYRLRATDERGNWMARKTQQKPYVIGTEYCETEYYE